MWLVLAVVSLTDGWCFPWLGLLMGLTFAMVPDVMGGCSTDVGAASNGILDGGA